MKQRADSRDGLVGLSSWQKRSSTIVPIRTGGDAPPLFLVAGPDGEVLYNRGLVQRLDPGQPVYGLQPLALDTNLEPHTRIEDLAADYVRDLLEFQPSGDYLIGGYCWSGLVAYEVARQLQERGRRSALVAVIDALYAKPPPRAEIERKKFADLAERDLRGKLAWVARRWRGLIFKIRIKTKWVVRDLLRRRGLRVAPLSLKEAGYIAWKRYVFEAQPSTVAVTYLHALEDGQRRPRPLGFWQGLVGAGLVIDEIDAAGIRHDNIMLEPHVEELGRRLSNAIDKAQHLAREETAAASG